MYICFQQLLTYSVTYYFLSIPGTTSKIEYLDHVSCTHIFCWKSDRIRSFHVFYKADLAISE